MRRTEAVLRATSRWVTQAGGLSFGCIQCGKCCIGSQATRRVRINYTEAVEAANSLSLPLAAFLHTYCTLIDGELVLKKDAEDKQCVMLNESSQCAIWHSKPTECSAYPFTPATLRSAASWRAESKVCPGINHEEADFVPSDLARRLAVSVDIKSHGDEEFAPQQNLDLLEGVPDDMLAEWETESEESVTYDDAAYGVRVVQHDDGAVEYRSLICDAAPEFAQANVPLDAEGDPILGCLSLEPSLKLLRCAFDATVMCTSGASSVALIGGGGFVLANNLAQSENCACVDVVEPSHAISKAARASLGVIESPKLQEHRTNGEEFLHSQPGAGSYKCIVIDASAGDASQPLVAPTPQMVEYDFLRTKLAQCLADGGVASVAIIASAPELQQVINRICKVFKHVAVAELSTKTVCYMSNSVRLEQTLMPPSYDELVGNEHGSRQAKRHYAFSVLQ